MEQILSGTLESNGHGRLSRQLVQGLVAVTPGYAAPASRLEFQGVALDHHAWDSAPKGSANSDPERQ